MAHTHSASLETKVDGAEHAAPLPLPVLPLPSSMCVNEKSRVTYHVKFDLATQLQTNTVCVFVGKRNTGKTRLILDIIHHKRHEISAAVVFSRTEAYNKEYQRHIPESFIYDDMNIDALERCLSRQIRLTAPPVTPLPAAAPQVCGTLLIVFDNCAATNSAYSSVMQRIFRYAYYYKIWLLVTASYVKQIPRSLRDHVDHWFILRENCLSEQRALYETLLQGSFPCFDDFALALRHYTNDYSALVASASCGVRSITTCISWYRAEIGPEIGPWKVGEESGMWRFHELHHVATTPATKTDWNSIVRNPTELLSTQCDKKASEFVSRHQIEEKGKDNKKEKEKDNVTVAAQAEPNQLDSSPMPVSTSLPLFKLDPVPRVDAGLALSHSPLNPLS